MKRFFAILMVLLLSLSLNSVSAVEVNEDELTWGLVAIGAPGAWEYTLGLQDIIVAVIDSGLDYTHPEFAGRVWNNTDEVLNGIDDDGNGYVDDIRGWNFFDDNNDVMDRLPSSHGTHVSGTIAAALDGVGVAGVAPNVTIMPLKVFGTDDEGGAVGLGDAIRYAVDNGANIISMSLGGPGVSSDMTIAVRDAWDAGLLLVAANGNEGARTVSFPAGFDEVVAVSAVNPDLSIADFSNTGSGTEIAAPGVDVNSSVRQGSNLRPFLWVNDTEYDANWMAFAASASDPVSGELEYIGLGRSSDVAGKNLTGKIALIQRGEITFKSKVGNATSVGAIGAIIFNNQPGNFFGTLQQPASIPAVSISQSDGQGLLNLLNQNQTLNGTIWSEPIDYAFLSGTSMATPHVSGVAALIWSLNTSLSNDEVRTILDRSTTDMGAAGRDSRYGFGFLNASRAMEVTLDNELPDISYDVKTDWNEEFERFDLTVEFTATDAIGVYSVGVSLTNSSGTTVPGPTAVGNRGTAYSGSLKMSFSASLGNVTVNLHVEDLRGNVRSVDVPTVATVPLPSTVSGTTNSTSEETGGNPVSLPMAVPLTAGLTLAVLVIRKRRS